MEPSQLLHVIVITVLLRNLTRRTILFNFTAALLIIQFQRSSNFSLENCTRLFIRSGIRRPNFHMLARGFIFGRGSAGEFRSNRIRESRVRNSACSGYDLRAIILLPGTAPGSIIDCTLFWHANDAVQHSNCSPCFGIVAHWLLYYAASGALRGDKVALLDCIS